MASFVLIAVVVVVVLLILFVKRKLAPPPSLEALPSAPAKFLYQLFLKKTSFDDRRRDNLAWSNEPMRRIFFFGRWEVMLGTPELAKELYTHVDVFEKLLLAKERPDLPNSKFFGINLVFSNGADWRKQHKVISPAFQTKNIVKIANKVFPECIRLLFDSEWIKVDDKPIEVHNWTQRFTLDVLGHAAFSFDLGSIKNPNAKYVSVYNEIVKGLFNPLLLVFPAATKLPLPFLKTLQERIDTFDSMLYEVIDNRKKLLASEGHNPYAAVDLLDLMLSSSELSAKELRDNLVIFFLAGHDTTANALSIAVYHLAKYPEIQEKARKEAMQIYQKSEAAKSSIEVTDYVPSFDDQKQYEFITAVIKEALRLYPSVAILPARELATDFTLGGVNMPKGTLVNVSIFDMHRNPKIWGPDSEEFIPERFLPQEHPWASLDHYTSESKRKQQPTRNDHPMAFNAFGASHRSCIGQQFSMIEQRMFLGTLLLRYELSLVPGFEQLKMGTTGLLAPKDLYINFKRRF